MQTQSLHYLLAVAEAGTFGKAAARLGLKTSTLTRRIAALEDELGATLLERRRTGVRLAAAGAIAIVEARRMIAAPMPCETPSRAPGPETPARFGWAYACRRWASPSARSW